MEALFFGELEEIGGCRHDWLWSLDYERGVPTNTDRAGDADLSVFGLTFVFS